MVVLVVLRVLVVFVFLSLSSGCYWLLLLTVSAFHQVPFACLVLSLKMVIVIVVVVVVVVIVICYLLLLLWIITETTTYIAQASVRPGE